MSKQIDDVARQICDTLGYTYLGYSNGGGFKRVYKADAGPAGIVAVKVMKSASASSRTPREIDAVSRCRHPNIGRFLTIGSTRASGLVFEYFVEEFLDGGTLTERTTTGPISVANIRIIGRELSSAIAHMSDLGFVHRDIKPDNIMFRSGSWSPVLVDFGLVRDLKAASLTRTWFPRGPGTPYFAAPEQLNNEKELIDWRTDQFALGATLCLTALGVHPFQHDPEPFGHSDTVDRVAMRGVHRPDLPTMLSTNALSPILTMTMPWPVQRFRLPTDLATAWA